MKELLFITDLSNQHFDEFYLSHYTEYFFNEYFDELREEEGIMSILNILSEEGKCERWLDIGAGSNSLLWAIALKEVKTIECCDIRIEAFKPAYDFLTAGKLPQCYLDVLKKFNKNTRDFICLQEKIAYYHVFDAFKTWPDKMERSYDLITEFGTFGQVNTPTEFINSVSYANAHLANKGKLIGANWIRQKGNHWLYGQNNDFVNEQLVNISASENNLRVTYLKKFFLDDELYKYVLVFVLSKK